MTWEKTDSTKDTVKETGSVHLIAIIYYIAFVLVTIPGLIQLAVMVSGCTEQPLCQFYSYLEYFFFIIILMFGVKYSKILFIKNTPKIKKAIALSPLVLLPILTISAYATPTIVIRHSCDEVKMFTLYKKPTFYGIKNDTIYLVKFKNTDEKNEIYDCNKLKNIDHKTFRLISKNMAVDKNGLYEKGKKIEAKNIDLNSVLYLGSYYVRDANNVYCLINNKLSKMPQADIRTFFPVMQLKNTGGCLFDAEDKNYKYSVCKPFLCAE